MHKGPKGKPEEGTTAAPAPHSAADADLSGGPTPEALRRRGNPSGRWGRVEDIALSALYMCTDAGAWITGTRLTIDGGTAHHAAGTKRPNILYHC